MAAATQNSLTVTAPAPPHCIGIVVTATASSPVGQTAGRPTDSRTGLVAAAAHPGSRRVLRRYDPQKQRAMPTFRVGGTRLWDSGTLWSLLEPARKQFDWTTLDRLVDSAHRANLPVLYTFGGTPQWAAPNAPLGPYPDGHAAEYPDGGQRIGAGGREAAELLFGDQVSPRRQISGRREDGDHQQACARHPGHAAEGRMTLEAGALPWRTTTVSSSSTSVRASSLGRVAYLMCQDWHQADDLVQASVTKLYVQVSMASPFSPQAASSCPH